MSYKTLILAQKIILKLTIGTLGRRYMIVTVLVQVGSIGISFRGYAKIKGQGFRLG